MNKAELVDAVAAAANLSKADAGRAVDAVVNSITAALKKGQQVSVVGFGTFGVKHRAARSEVAGATGDPSHSTAISCTLGLAPERVTSRVRARNWRTEGSPERSARSTRRR